jgi:hypothetical protein
MPQSYFIQKQDLYGRAYAPYNTGFVALKNNGQTIVGGSDNIIQFPVINYQTTGYNPSNGYNNSTHRFTAPTRGLYQFSVAFMGSSSNAGYVRIGIKKNNGTHFGLTYQTITPGAGQYESLVTAAAIYLEQNDFVDVVAFITMDVFSLDNTGSFTGFLVA